MYWAASVLQERGVRLDGSDALAARLMIGPEDSWSRPESLEIKFAKLLKKRRKGTRAREPNEPPWASLEERLDQRTPRRAPKRGRTHLRSFQQRVEWLALHLSGEPLDKIVNQVAKSEPARWNLDAQSLHGDPVTGRRVVMAAVKAAARELGMVTRSLPRGRPRTRSRRTRPRRGDDRGHSATACASRGPRMPSEPEKFAGWSPSYPGEPFDYLAFAAETQRLFPNRSPRRKKPRKQGDGHPSN